MGLLINGEFVDEALIREEMASLRPHYEAMMADMEPIAREIQLKDWWRVAGRELKNGLALGVLLATIGFLRIYFWPMREKLYGPHYALVAVTVAASLIGVVLFGVLCGSMLPFILRRLGLDPATASAPFVATLVDVTGVMIYFTTASLILKGTLL